MLVLAFATLALASAPRWAACMTSALALMAIVPLAGSRRVLTGPKPLLVLLSIPLLATALQLLPLPAGLVRLISPASHALAKANAAAYGHSMPGFLPLSQDWPATLVELAKFAGYFSFAYVCSWLTASRRARLWLLVTLCTVGTIVALCALGHRAVGATSLLGLYKPEFSNPLSISPFFNPNHLAGYLAFITPLCVGLAVHRRSWMFLAMGAVCALTSVQTLSRGGIVSLSVGLGLALVLLAGVRKNRRSRGNTGIYQIAIALGLLIVGGAVFGATAGQELWDLDLQREQDIGKFMAWGAAPALLASSPWVGVGRGAFEHSFTHVQPANGVTFSHIENEYIQIVVDWGLPVALAIAVAFIFLFRSLLRRGSMDAIAAGCLGGLAALLVHSIVDFGPQLPGIALPAIAVVATLLPGTMAVVDDKKRRRLVVGLRLVGVVVGVLVCALALSPVGARPAEDIASTRELQVHYGGSEALILAEASRISKRHPSSYLLAAKTAGVLWKKRDPVAFAALGRALALNPNHAGVHLLAAQMLASSQKPRQAIAEYRAALEISGPKLDVLRKMVAQFPDVGDLLLVVPEDPTLVGRFAVVFLQLGRADATEALAKQAIARGDATFMLYKAGIEAALQRSQVDWAIAAGKRANDVFQTEESLLLYVKALRSGEAQAVAIEELVKTHRVGIQRSPNLLNILCALQLEVQDWHSARETAEALMEAAGRTTQFRIIAHGHLATIEEQTGNSHQARWHRQQATDLRDR
tara:strand:+ start:53072 stop:55333 length:2262 start_codon:yes stop_codon:yes gene_type:complete